MSLVPEVLHETVLANDVPVTDGVFTVSLDFGVTIDAVLFVEIAVRYGTETGPYTLLSPRQELKPAPFARNAHLLDGNSPGSGQGNAYSIADTAVEPNRRYWYWLEGVSLNGATIRHGPVSVTVTVPTAVTMGEFQAGSRDQFVLEIWVLAVASLKGGGLLMRRRRSPPASRLS